MAKKIVKRRKLKIFNFLLVLLILIGLFFGVKLYLDIPVKNIIITKTNYLNDDYILNLANLKNYPKYFTISSTTIKKKLQASPYISKVQVKRKFFHILQLDITENKAIYYDFPSNKIVLSNGTKVDSSNDLSFIRLPRLLNDIPNDKYEKFVKGMSNVEKDILGKISDIQYEPNNLDKDRFLLYMDDGNMVYLTLTKFKMINYYNKVLSQLENHKGILYLDNGNHFQIKE